MQTHRLRKSASYSHAQEPQADNDGDGGTTIAPQEIFECNQQLFDEIIEQLPASAEILSRIKLEYELVIRKIQESRSNTAARNLLNVLEITETATLSNYHKRIQELEFKLEKIRADNVRIQREMEKLRQERDNISADHDNELQSLYKTTRPHMNSSRRRALKLSMEETTSIEHLMRKMQRVEDELIEAKEVSEKKFVPVQKKTRLQDQLKEKEAVRTELISENKNMSIVRKRIGIAIKSVESYQPYLEHHQIDPSQFPLESYIQAVIANQPDGDYISDEEPEDPAREMEAEMILDSHEKFNELFEKERYAEAALHAARSPKGILRTLNTLLLFKNSARHQPEKKLPLLCYCECLLRCAPAYKPISLEESLECATCVLQQGEVNKLTHWIAQGSMPSSVELGSLIFGSCSCSKLCRCGCKSLAFTIFERCRELHKAALCLIQQGKFVSFLSLSTKSHFSKQDYGQIICSSPGVELAMFLLSPSASQQPLLTPLEIMDLLMVSGRHGDAMQFIQAYQMKFGLTITQIVMNADRTEDDLLQTLSSKLYKNGLTEMAIELESLLIVKTAIRKSLLLLEQESKEAFLQYDQKIGPNSESSSVGNTMESDGRSDGTASSSSSQYISSGSDYSDDDDVDNDDDEENDDDEDSDEDDVDEDLSDI